METWIQSIVIKRVVLALSAAIAAHLVALLAAPVTANALTYLAGIGLTITVVVDQAKFANFLTVGLFALSQGAHEWLAAKYPEVGKYI